MAVTRALGGTAVEDFLLARHLLIDRLLEAAIERGEISQVIEVAAGMSPRGWRFAERHGERLTYIETDLPEMAARKRAALERIGPLGPGAPGGRARRAQRRRRAEPGEGRREPGPRARRWRSITEGLLPYLDRDDVLALWRRIARLPLALPARPMLSDLHLASENGGLIVAIGTHGCSRPSCAAGSGCTSTRRATRSRR